MAVTQRDVAWVVLVADAAAVGGLRQVAGLRVCEDAAGGLWLAGPTLSEALRRRVAAVPCWGRYRVDERQRLVPEGGRVPERDMPEGRWWDLAAWVQPVVPTAGLPGEGPEAVELRVVRDESWPSVEPTVLWTDVRSLASWAEQAAEARLRAVRFAASGQDKSVVLWGSPLPVLPGRRCVVDHGVAVPAGLRWEPAVSASVLRSWLGLGEGDLGLLWEGGIAEVIPAEGFVAGSRSAMRQTVQPLLGGVDAER